MTSTNSKIKKTEIKLSTQIADILQSTVQMPVNTKDIDFSPLNYRKMFSDEAIQLFAQELSQHGMISPVLLRRKENERYELIAGERRLRAARMANMQTVPAQIVDMTDQQVREVQLSENLQRENPHPVNEASAIGDMQRAGISLEEIALRLGKSRQFVYTRLKLLSLIVPFQEMFFSDVISLQDALLIATLSADSQEAFFDEHGKGWQKKKDFRLVNLNYYLDQYRYDLKRAPFNPKDKLLIPEVGACLTCPSNSATIRSLFPEAAKESICSNRECYNKKCSTHFIISLTSCMQTYQPVALIYRHPITEGEEKLLPLVAGASELPRHNYFDISILEKPEEPSKEDCMYEDEKGKVKLNREEYDFAMQEYSSELEAYNLHVKSGHYKIGLLLDGKNFEPVFFTLEKIRQTKHTGQVVTAKEVQEAIRSGTATPELLKGEIDRIRQREKRSEELDREKIQLNVFDLFSAFATKAENHRSLTTADMAAARLIIYQSLDYTNREMINKKLFKSNRSKSSDSSESLFSKLTTLTKQEFSFLIRLAMAGKHESKYPSQPSGYFLFQMAKQAGLPVKKVEDAQAEITKVRKEKQTSRIKTLEEKIKKQKSK